MLLYSRLTPLVLSLPTYSTSFSVNFVQVDKAKKEEKAIGVVFPKKYTEDKVLNTAASRHKRGGLEIDRGRGGQLMLPFFFL